MIKQSLVLLSLCLGLCLVTTLVAADTVYIRDTLYVPLRGGQSTEHRILHRGLKSGTKLERLDVNDETGYSRVRVDDNLEGWLQTQYLVDEPIAGDRLDSVTSQFEELETRHQQTLRQLRETNESSDQMSAATEELTGQNEALSKELEDITSLAADVIAIDEENKQLKEEQAGLLTQIDELANANESLLDNNAQEWFLRGAGTILIGLLFGFWIGRRIYHRRNTGGWS
ncbi:MAG: TIGR04211 family SH3 domain-containing protein [Gammaproteobacteria bacterium]|jgi:SH3 domain protein|nr:TIGR04211 family SH3 domain-containing protein [Gammaproteobacteria bacterium]